VPHSQQRRVEFGGVHWVASRPLVIAVLKDIKFCQSFGLLVELNGTESELIAAEVATEETFRDADRCRERTHHDIHGDHFTLCHRAGKWDLRLFINAWGTRGIPCDEHPFGDQPWWTVHGAAASALTAQILARLAK
jgi:hypothetical protein